MIGLVVVFMVYFYLCNRGKVRGEMVCLLIQCVDMTDAECCR